MQTKSKPKKDVKIYLEDGERMTSFGGVMIIATMRALCFAADRNYKLPVEELFQKATAEAKKITRRDAFKPRKTYFYSMLKHMASQKQGKLTLTMDGNRILTVAVKPFM